MTNMQWFRSVHGAPTDPKWLRVARKAGQPAPVVVAVAWALMDYASRGETRGDVTRFSADDHAAFLGVEPADVAAVVQALEDIGWIADGEIANWRRHQPERERPDDLSTERVRAHRERAKAKTGVSNSETTGNADLSKETPCNTMERQETPRGEEIREEENPSTPTPSPGTAREATVLAKWGRAVKTILEGRWPDDPGVAMVPAGLVETWHADGHDLELDVLPIVRQLTADKQGDPIRTLKYFSEAIQRRHAERKANGNTPTSSVRPWEPTTAYWDRVADEYAKTGQWTHGNSPEIGGCQCPAEILRRHGVPEDQAACRAWRIDRERAHRLATMPADVRARLAKPAQEVVH